MSRGLRNNNPGNIRRSSARYKGEVHPSRDEEFKEFQSMAYGYRAMFVLLDTYRTRYGLNTIRTILMRYAPPTESHTTSYIEFVVRHTGIGADTPLNTRHMRDMIPIVAAMSEVENGVVANITEVEQGWRLFIEG